jgi:hypothetical protein
MEQNRVRCYENGTKLAFGIGKPLGFAMRLTVLKCSVVSPSASLSQRKVPKAKDGLQALTGWQKHQRSDFGCESWDERQSGNICAMECATKAGLCRRLSRRVNIRARKNPAKAPRNASVTERVLNVRSPWLVRMNPV